MTRRIVRLPQARRDIISAALYLEERNPAAASRFVRAVTDTQVLLAQSPGLGAPRDFGGVRLKGLRMHPVQGFRRWLVFYLERPGGIEILRVLHGARDLEALLGEDDE
jgi:toxin ParE1/3/4